MNKLKKLLALLLCAAMTLAVVPAFAVEAEQRDTDRYSCRAESQRR